jgi:hypothetical protein
MARIDVKVRLAQNSEAHLVAKLVSEIFHMEDWELKFESVFPYWLVAEIAGEIVGAVNLRISIPISSVEMLTIDPKLTWKQRATVGCLLIDSAAAIVASSGSEAVSSMIPDSMPDYLKVVKSEGYVVGNHGSIVFGRFR